jgi:D-xylose 1-dehydrogenase
MSERAVYRSLDGKSVFVTGGASGIGAGLVTGFAAQGCKVAFADIDDAAAAALVEDVGNRFGAAPWFRRTDLADVEAIDAVIAEAQAAQGRLDVLVNNVGNDSRHSVEETDARAWRSCLAINLDAAFFASRAAFPFMRAQGSGSIINLGSINALLGLPNMPGYVTAKAGLMGMTRALAREFGEHRIRVNAILPGWVVTDRQLSLWLTPEAEAEWKKSVALKDRLTVADVANLALFLASDDSRMITGQSLVVDAGRT